MNYETATDFELSECLFRLSSPSVFDGEIVIGKGSDNGIAIFDANKTGISSFKGSFNCTNWNDIMPIAVDLKVKLDPRRTSPKLGWMVSIDDQNYSVNQSPQCALVICCIKVLEANK